MNPATNPNKNTVSMALLGMLNKTPKPKAAIPDQMETSNMSKIISNINLIEKLAWL